MKVGGEIFYLEVRWKIHGILVARILWYSKLRKDSEDLYFVFNPYYLCVANMVIHTNQHDMRFHVEDILFSHVDPKLNDVFYQWYKGKYSNLKTVEFRQGKHHELLVRFLDFGLLPEKCLVVREDYAMYMIKIFPEKLIGSTLTTL